MSHTTIERIQVSENHRFLVTETGAPFFWLGDTGFELFHRLNYADAELYLENRRQKGFNVVLAVVLAQQDGLNTPNMNGHTPLLGNDPNRPNEHYFKYIDCILRLAASKGIYIGLLPTWGDKVTPQWEPGPAIFTLENSFAFGKYLGDRYKSYKNLIWVLGGDRSGKGFEGIWSQMAGGLTEGTGQMPLITYHPQGLTGSSMWFHQSEWLNINMWQSGHYRSDMPNWEMITRDYNREQPKPVFDGESNYEDHPVDPYTREWKPEYGRFNDYDIRKQAYRAVFAGACGHTYGHHSVWQMYSPSVKPITFPVYYWYEAIDRPGSHQLIHLKNLMLSRPYLTRIPDQNLLISDPGEYSDHVQATRAADGSYAFIYIPKASQRVEVDLSRLAGPVKAWWYDPRNGKTFEIGEFNPNQHAATFTSPIAGSDWVLVLDAISAGYPTPGKITTLK